MKMRTTTRGLSVVAISIITAAVLSASPAYAAAPPSEPALISPLAGGTSASGSPLAVRAEDTDSSDLTVTFHGTTHATTPGGSGAPFSFVVLPDTQNYILTPAFTPNLTAQLQWIVDNRTAMNTAFVAGVGEIVDNYQSEPQWDASRRI